MPQNAGESIGQFLAGRTYDHVHFVVVDASGHSSVVRSNPSDISSRAFDILENKTRARFQSQGERHRCAHVESWGWQGDGGMFIVWDPDESVSSATAIETAKALLELDLGHARDEFKALRIRGELNIRIAIHKGTLTYRGPELQGSIHSPDINFAAHLEKATPPNCIALSGPVFHSMPGHQESCFSVGTFEDKEVFLTGIELAYRSANVKWLSARGLEGGRQVYAIPLRPSQEQKAKFISLAESDILDLGTGLRTCANYLVTGERPRPYRDAVVESLERGITYRCVLYGGTNVKPVNPLHPAEQLARKVEESLEKLELFAATLPSAVKPLFQVWGSPRYPGMAALCIDMHEPHGMVIYSPYLPSPPAGANLADVQRGDMPHYMVEPGQVEMYASVLAYVHAFGGSNDLEQLL